MLTFKFSSCSLVLFLVYFILIQATDINASDIECSKRPNDTCGDCISDSKCLYCNEDNSCKPLVFSGIIPQGCALSKARWVTCYFNLEALIIGVSVGGGILLLLLLCGVCYCYNKTCKSIADRNLKKIERKYQKEKEELDMRRNQRKAERAEKYDAIRVKYGLKSGNEYSKLDES